MKAILLSLRYFYIYNHFAAIQHASTATCQTSLKSAVSDKILIYMTFS